MLEERAARDRTVFLSYQRLEKDFPAARTNFTLLFFKLITAKEQFVIESTQYHQTETNVSLRDGLIHFPKTPDRQYVSAPGFNRLLFFIQYPQFAFQSSRQVGGYFIRLYDL